MNKLFASIAMISLSATLYGCGGDNGEAPPAQVTAQNISVPANGTTTQAVTNLPFVFPTGVPSFGTTSTTTVTFTNTSTTPAFTITSGGNTATGTTTFGSCDFHVQTSNFATGSSLAQGALVRVPDPCAFNLTTKGQVAGTTQGDTLTLTLFNVNSLGDSVQVTITLDGQVIIANTPFGSVTLTPVTGPTGG